MICSLRFIGFVVILFTGIVMDAEEGFCFSFLSCFCSTLISLSKYRYDFGAASDS